MATLSPLRVLILGEDKYSKEFKKLNRSVARAGRTIKNVGRSMTTYITAPIVGAGVASIVMSKNLNKAMANVGTLIPGETAKLQRYKREVQDLGIAMGHDAEVMAEGLYETLSLFGTATDPLNKLGISAKAAKAGVSSVKDALGLLGAVTKGYGDETDAAAQRVSDFSFLTVKLGKTTFPELAASMGKIVPLAATLNISQEELFGSMATLTGVTGNTAEVVTQLRSVLGAVVQPSDAMGKAAKRTAKEMYGQSFATAAEMVQTLGLAKSMKVFEKAAGGSAQKMMDLMKRKEGLTAALALTGAQAADFARKTAEMGKAAGSTDAAFKAQMEGINKSGEDWDRFVRRIKKTAVMIGDKLFPVVIRIVEKLEPFLNKIMGLSDESLELGLKIAGVVAVLGPMTMALGQAVIVTSVMLKLLGPGFGLAGAFRALRHPIRSTSTLVGGLISRFKLALGLGGKLSRVPPPPPATGRVGAPGTRGAGGAGVGGVVNVAAAGIIGYAIGDIINEKFFAPQNKMMGDFLQKAEGFSAANAKTAEQVAAATRESQKLREGLVKNVGTTEFYAGNVASKFTGDQSPMDRYSDALKALNEEDRKLAEKSVALTTAALEKAEDRLLNDTQIDEWATDPAVIRELAKINKRDAEASVKIEFEGLPDGATARVRKQRGAVVQVEKRGAVMEGAL